MLSAQDCNASSPVIPLLEHLIMRPSRAQSDLLEHQLKQMLRDADIPVLSSQLISNAQELKQLRLSYPIVLKAQVHSNDVTEAGGVATVTNTIDAITTAHRLFDTQIRGEYPEYLLAESLYEAEHCIGIGIEQQPETGHTVLQGWVLQGWNLSSEVISLDPDQAKDRTSSHATATISTSVAEATQQRESTSQATLSSRPQRLILAETSRSQIEQFGQQLGLEDNGVATLTEIVEKMNSLLDWLNLRSLVIDPLAFNAEGEAIALDGQIRFQAKALEQQPELKKLFSPKPEIAPPVVQLEGNIGVLSNGMGEAMSTVDSLKRAGGEAAAFVSVKEQQGAVARKVQKTVFSSRRTHERMGQALDNLARVKDVKLILVNWSGLAGSCRDVAETIVNYFHRTGQHRHLRGARLPVPLVVKLTGPEAELGRHLLQEVGIVAVESLDEAIAEGIGLAKIRSVA